MHLDPQIHVMMCTRCFHLNEVTADVCVECRYDMGIPLFRESAERMRSLHRRLLTGVDDGEHARTVAIFDNYFTKEP